MSTFPVPRTNKNLPQLLGESAAIVSLRREIEAAARTDAKVLVLGETGSGKEVVARLIHEQSSRMSRAFVAVNCSGIPETLLESELFGHTRGSFTGAYRDKPGLVRQADRGTLFLDELGEMSLRMQAVLLRFRRDRRDSDDRCGRCDRPFGCAVDHRDQSQSSRAHRGRCVPRGSVLPSEHHSDPCASASRARRRCHAAAAALPASRGRDAPAALPRADARRRAVAHRVSLARQRSRAEEPR